MATFNHACYDFGVWVDADTPVYPTSAYRLELNDGRHTGPCDFISAESRWVPHHQSMSNKEVSYAKEDVARICMYLPGSRLKSTANREALINYQAAGRMGHERFPDEDISQLLPKVAVIDRARCYATGKSSNTRELFSTITETSFVVLKPIDDNELRLEGKATGKVIVSGKSPIKALQLIKQTGAELELTVTFDFWFDVWKQSSPFTDAVSVNVPMTLVDIEVINPGRLNKTKEEWLKYLNQFEMNIMFTAVPTWPDFDTTKATREAQAENDAPEPVSESADPV